jgi:hypothetical protein
MGNSHRILVEKFERKSPLERLKQNEETNIRSHLIELMSEDIT